jgi:hypothetical protein
MRARGYGEPLIEKLRVLEQIWGGVHTP